MMVKKINREALLAGQVDLSGIVTGEELPPVTPGEILREEFMLPLNLSARALARDIGVPANRITEIINGERAITADTALRLGHRLNMSAEFWMNLQVAHDLEMARRHWHPEAA
jgi:addiction module HigA family antidote